MSSSVLIERDNVDNMTREIRSNTQINQIIRKVSMQTCSVNSIFLPYDPLSRPIWNQAATSTNQTRVRWRRQEQEYFDMFIDKIKPWKLNTVKKILWPRCHPNMVIQQKDVAVKMFLLQMLLQIIDPEHMWVSLKDYGMLILTYSGWWSITCVILDVTDKEG